MSVSKMTKTRVSIEDEQAEFSWQFSESLYQADRYCTKNKAPNFYV